MTDLTKILNDLVVQYGESVLSDHKRVNSCFSDLAQDVPKARKNALIKSIEHGFANTLKDIPENEREFCKQQLARKLHEEEGFVLDLCAETLDLLEKVLFGEAPKKIFCKKCGKELQEEWKACPFCLDGSSQEKSSEVIPAVSTEIPIASSAANSANVNDTEQFKKKLKHTKIGLIVTIIIAVGMGIGLIDLYNNYIWFNNQYWNLSNDLRRIRNLYKVIEVTSLSVGNVNVNNEWINNPGSRLVSSEMRFLRPAITYNSAISGEVTFYIKIIRPDGTLYTGTSSPAGYSTSSTVTVNSSGSQTVNLIGWGNADRSNYPAGEYTIEIWYNNIMLRSQKVTIHP